MFRSAGLRIPRYGAPRPVRPVLTSLDLGRVYVPLKGIPFSLVAHGLALVLTLSFPMANVSVRRVSPREKPEVGAQKLETEKIMWLPPVAPSGPGLEANSEPAPGEAPQAPAPPAPKGLVYPGPQTIVSNPPHPTNRSETLLQPDIEDLPTLAPPLMLPNFVMIAKPEAILPSELSDEESPAEAKSAPSEVAKAEPPAPIETPKPEPAEPLIPPRLPKPVILSNLPDLVPLQETLTPPPLPPGPADEPRIEPLPFKPESLKLPELDLPEPLAMTPVPVSTDQPVELPAAEDSSQNPQPGSTTAAAEPPEPVRPRVREPVAPVTVSGTGEIRPTGRANTGAVRPSVSVDVGPSVSLPGGDEVRNMLALSPLPAVPGTPVSIPPGEARGQFVISPRANLESTGTEPGSAAGEETSDGKLENQVPAVASESPTFTQSGAVVNIHFGSKKASAGSGSGSGTANSGISVTGSGSGNGAGFEPALPPVPVRAPAHSRGSRSSGERKKQEAAQQQTDRFRSSLRHRR